MLFLFFVMMSEKNVCVCLCVSCDAFLQHSCWRPPALRVLPLSLTVHPQHRSNHAEAVPLFTCFTFCLLNPHALTHTHTHIRFSPRPSFARPPVGFLISAAVNRQGRALRRYAQASVKAQPCPRVDPVSHSTSRNTHGPLRQRKGGGGGVLAPL